MVKIAYQEIGDTLKAARPATQQRQPSALRPNAMGGGATRLRRIVMQKKETPTGALDAHLVGMRIVWRIPHHLHRKLVLEAQVAEREMPQADHEHGVGARGTRPNDPFMRRATRVGQTLARLA